MGIAIDSLDEFSLLNQNFDFIKVLSFTENKDYFFQRIETNKNIYLSCGTEKFENFLRYNEIAKKRNQNIENANIDDLDKLWEEVKRGEKSL